VTRYVERPEELDAIVFTGENTKEIEEFTGLEIGSSGHAWIKAGQIVDPDRVGAKKAMLFKPDTERKNYFPHYAIEGYYVIKFDSGYIDTMSAKDFERMYMPKLQNGAVVLD
jgi:hypothetical protein